MTVRAKFTVNAITRTMGQMPDPSGAKNERGYSVYVPTEMWTVKMSPVYGNGDPTHENTKFWQASPSGMLELGTVNKAAVEQFDIGREFYVDFTPA